MANQNVRMETTPRDLQRRLGNFNRKKKEVLRITNEASLLVLHENVPSYPDRPASTYDRTGTLGRKLGSSESGGKAGSPDIFEQKPLGQSGWRGSFGTNLDYAVHVISEEQQARIHRGIWWTMKTIADKAQNKIIRLHDRATAKMANYVNGVGI